MPMAMKQLERQEFNWPDARGSRASGTGEREWFDSECGMGRISRQKQGAGPVVTRGWSVGQWWKGR